MKRILFIFLFLPALSFAKEPFWEYLKGPEGGIMRSIKINQDNDIFIGSNNGVFRSTDYGESWEWVLKGGKIYKSAISKHGVIFVNRIVDSIGGPYGKREFLYSFNNGASWQMVRNCELEYPKHIGFDNNDILYASKINDDIVEIHYSEDIGKTWHKNVYNFNKGDDLELYSLFVQKKSEIVITGYYQDYGIAYISDDKGKSWRELGTLNEKIIFEFYINSKNHYFAGNDEGMFFSSDSGKTWEDIIESGKARRLISLNDKELYVSINTGKYYSSDDGYTWEKVCADNTSLYNIDSQGNFYGTIVNDFKKSTDRGKTWQTKNNGFFSHRINDLGCDQKGNIFALITTGIYKSSNNGLTWDFYFPPIQICYNIEVSKRGNIYVSYFHHDYRTGGLYRSTDHGTTWDTIPMGYNYFSINDIKVDDDENIYLAVGRKSLLVTNDMGATWNMYGQEVAIGFDCVELNSEGHIFIGCSSFDMHCSTDGGNTWVQKIDQFWGFGLTEIVIHPTNGVGYAGGGLGLYRTIDNGRSWENKNMGINDIALDSNGFFYTTFHRISKDGDSLEHLTTGYLPIHYPVLIEYSSTGYLYSATEYGGLYRSRVPITSLNETPEYPKAITLRQNAPNPFEENTEISYYIDKPAYTRIKLYNMLGIEVAEYGGRFMAEGRHTFIVNGSGLAGGVYILRLESAGKVASKTIHKMR